MGCSEGIMVPLSERRHRIHEHEVPEVVKGLVLRLRQLIEERWERESANTAFRALYRLTNPEPGRPNYPEFTWEGVRIYLERYLSEDYLP